MKKYRNEIIIVFINLFIVSLFCFTNIFGSTMDFLTQHIVFPNYLRELFYSSGKIIPNFMIHLGAGQNIFNIAYYGLLSPVILISYFFPFIKMIDYIVISNIILLVVSNLLFYRFLKYSFSEKMSLFLTLLFCFSGPILFHFHRHFMFVNYMPFLILGLININKGKWNRVIIDIFLIIMTSFYYSIPSIICLIIYYIYINFNSFNLKSFLKFLSYIFISILMSSVLLLPTVYSILSSRAGGGSFNIGMIFPNFSLSNVLYGAYSTGLSSILIISILYLFYSKKKNNLFLGIVFSILFFIPIFMFILNGGLYIRGKCFIPFIPMLIYIIGLFFKNIKSINIKNFLILLIIFNLIVLINYHNFLYYIDLLFMVLLIIFYKKFKIKYIFSLLLILDFVLCINLNLSENFIPNNYDFDYSFKSNNYYRVSNLNNDFVNVNGGNYISSFYSSTGNKFYNNLYHNIFKVNNSSINSMSLNSSSNILFNQFMGNKYIISDYDIGYPYNKIGNNLYQLDQVYPIGYVNHNTINRDYFNSLEYPYNLDLLLNYIVTDDSLNKPVSNIKEVNLNYNYDLSNSYIDNGKLYVNSDDTIKIHINDDMDGKILFISLNGQEEQSNDISMTINGQANILTHKGWRYPNNNYDFNYCISGSDLEIKVSPGVYNISDIHTYVLDNSLISSNDFDLFNIDVMNSDEISGSIDVTQDGYFILKVPYDKGFKIFVNDDIIDYSMMDDTFIGFYLNKGFYNIRVEYEPPYLNHGKCLSIVGFIIFVCLFRRREK